MDCVCEDAFYNLDERVDKIEEEHIEDIHELREIIKKMKKMNRCIIKVLRFLIEKVGVNIDSEILKVL